MEAFAFVCGGDMLVYFDKWYKYEELMKMLPFFVFSRTSTNSQEFIDCVNRFRDMGMEIILMDDEIPNISSTDFRNGLSGSILPKKIYNYIVLFYFSGGIIIRYEKIYSMTYGGIIISQNGGLK